MRIWSRGVEDSYTRGRSRNLGLGSCRQAAVRNSILMSSWGSSPPCRAEHELIPTQLPAPERPWRQKRALGRRPLFLGRIYVREVRWGWEWGCVKADLPRTRALGLPNQDSPPISRPLHVSTSWSEDDRFSRLYPVPVLDTRKTCDDVMDVHI